MKHLSNEEKAKDLLNCKHCRLGKGICFNVTPPCVSYRDIIKMAELKDKQIDTIMLTIEGCLRSFFESQGNTKESIDNFIYALKTQINENLSKL